MPESHLYNPAKPIDEVLKDSIRSFGEDFYIKYLRHAIFFHWKDIVGEINAKKITPVRIDYKNLFVYIKDSAWKGQFLFLKPQMIKNINEFAERELVIDILLTKPHEYPKEQINKNPENAPNINIKKELQKINLTDEELNEIEQMCKNIEDEKFKNKAIQASINRKKLEKFHIKHGWHKCNNCNALCPPYQVYCDVCYRLEREKLYDNIRTVMRDVPWATYAEISNEATNAMPHMIDECTPETVNSVRASLIQQTARSLNINNERQAIFLTMLYKCISPEQITDKLISRTLYKFRHDIPKPKEDLF